MKNINLTKLIGEYLSIMGHNVISSTLVGSLTDRKESQNPDNVIEENADDVSFWQAVDETVLDEMEEGENPYIGRKIGVTKRVQEREQERALEWWRNSICPSCKKGFNSKSSNKQCHSCDKYTHIKKKCISTAEDNTVFLCKVCKPVEEVPMANNTGADQVDGFNCKQCEFKSDFKYNLSRHLLKQHGTFLNEPNLEPAIIVALPKSTNADPPVTLQSMLNELGLTNLIENFESEGVDLKMLISLNKADQKECFKEVGVKRFGDRHKLVERIAIEKRKADDVHIEEPIVPEVTTNSDDHEMDFLENMEEDVSSDPSETTNPDEHEMDFVDNLEEDVSPANHLIICEMCEKSTQHACRICNKPVCVINCSVEDPNSTNEMHRVHKTGDKRCTNSAFECPSCSKLFSTPKELQVHIERHHPQESSLSLISEASSLSGMYVNCTICDKKFENELHMNHHRVRVHEYGETCNLYPCEECGFSAGDIDTLNEHVGNGHNETFSASHEAEKLLSEEFDETSLSEEFDVHEIPVQKRIKQNLREINFEDDSDDDREWEPTLEEEDDLTKEIEDLRSNKKRKLKNTQSELKSAPPKKKVKEHEKALICDAPAKKKMKDTNNLLFCEFCDVTFSRKDNLKRHVLKKHK